MQFRELCYKIAQLLIFHARKLNVRHFSADKNRSNQYTVVDGNNYNYNGNNNLIDDGKYLYYYDCENHLTGVNDQSYEPMVLSVYDFAGRCVSEALRGEPERLKPNAAIDNFEGLLKPKKDKDSWKQSIKD